MYRVAHKDPLCHSPDTTWYLYPSMWGNPSGFSWTHSVEEAATFSYSVANHYKEEYKSQNPQWEIWIEEVSENKASNNYDDYDRAMGILG